MSKAVRKVAKAGKSPPYDKDYWPRQKPSKSSTKKIRTSIK